jgi:hypothetical protein
MHSDEAISSLVDSINISDFSNISWQDLRCPYRPSARRLPGGEFFGRDNIVAGHADHAWCHWHGFAASMIQARNLLLIEILLFVDRICVLQSLQGFPRLWPWGR